MLRIGQNKAKNIWCFDENFVSLQMELITVWKRYIMRTFSALLFVMFALSANAADGTVGTVSVQKENNVSVNGEAPLSTNRKYSSDKRV